MKRYDIVDNTTWEAEECFDGHWCKYEDVSQLQKNFTLAMILLSNVGSTDGDLSNTFINEINKFIREADSVYNTD